MSDENTQISITFNKKLIERLLYWLIIIVLLVLLIISWTKSGTCPTGTTKDTSGSNAAATPPAVTPPAATPPAATPPAATASCSDGIKNQDETDIDCGGSKCGPCSSGKACTVAGDCIGGYCTAGKCTSTAPVTLSNKLELSLNSITTFANPTNNTYHSYKVMSVSYTVKNGLPDDVTPHVKVFVKDKSSAMCLNTYTSVDDANNCAVPYAEFDLPKIASGKTLTDSTDIKGTYVQQTIGNSYDPSDPSKDSFKVVMYLYDSAGDPIGGKSISAAYTFSP